MEELFLHLPFSQLPLADDFMFGEVMHSPEICTMFLESLLRTRIDHIEYITKQQELSESFVSHGIRIDVYLRDDRRTVYSVEMQRSRIGGMFKRIRYYQGVIDRNNLEKGQRYTLVPESYIILVCTFDPFGKGLAVYERVCCIKDCPGAVYEDGTHVLLLNSAYTRGNAERPVLEFLDCIRSNNTDAGSYTSALMRAICPAIAEVRKDTSKEAIYMTLDLKLQEILWVGEERGEKRGEARGEARGKEKGIRALVKSLQKYTQNKEAVRDAVAEQFQLSPEEAERKVSQYW